MAQDQHRAKTMQETAQELQRRVMELLAMQQDKDGDSSKLAAAADWPSLDPEIPAISTTTMRDPSLTLLLPLLILLSTLLFLLIVFLVFLIVLKRKRRSGIALLDSDGPIDLAREEEMEGEGGLAGVEERWLEQQDSSTRTGYERAKLWQQQYLPNSMSTDITLSQFLSIQEKGVSAWSFEPDYETNSPLFVTSRTEVTFLEDGAGMAAQEGGACCVQSNLPLPRINEVYYWECKIFEKPESTNIAIGLSTKPYPTFRMPGWNRYSIGYFSADGFKCHNYPFAAQSYGPPLAEGDVLGVGYRPRTGAVFFTRNGKKLDDAYIGLTKHNLFPTVAADGAATIHVNLGQAGFVFIEANVKKWGLAPTIGTLAPPPAYGSERGSILLEAAGGPQAGGADSAAGSAPLAPPPQLPHHQRQRSDEAAAVAALTSPSDSHDVGSSSSSSSRTRNPTHRRVQSHSTAPLRPSPLRTSMTRQRTSSYTGSVNSASSSPVSIPGTLHHDDEYDYEGQDESDELLPHNPPTPGQTDISLRAMSPFSRRRELEDRAERQRSQSSDASSSSTSQRPPSPPTSSTPPYHASTSGSGRAPAILAPPRLPGDVSPPSYQLIDANQYPAGVAEAMLENMPEDQFAALFAHAASANAGQDGRSRSGGSNAQGVSQAQGSTEQQGLGLRGLLNGVFGRSTSSESTSSNV